MSTFWNDLLRTITTAIPPIVAAILILILAYIVAKIAKSLVMKLLRKLKIDQRTKKLGLADEQSGSFIVFVGKLVFLIVFLLFMPGVMSLLGIQNVASPLTNLLTTLFNFMPNILAAVIILMVGTFIASLIRQLVKPVLKRLNIDRFQEKAGIPTTESTALSSVLSYVVYVIILIPVVIAAIQVLNITAISGPAISMLNRIINLLPNIFVAIGLVLIGAFIARLVARLLTQILLSIGTDKLARGWLPQGSAFSLAKTIGEAVKYIIIVIFLVEAFNVVNLLVLRQVGTMILLYLPAAIAAVLVMGIALFLAFGAASLILKKMPNAKSPALITKVAILTVGVFMALNQLGIAPAIVNTAFIVILGALAIAFAISFGVGGREFASRVLNRLEARVLSLQNEASSTPAPAPAPDVATDLAGGEDLPIVGHEAFEQLDQAVDKLTGSRDQEPPAPAK